MTTHDTPAASTWYHVQHHYADLVPYDIVPIPVARETAMYVVTTSGARYPKHAGRYHGPTLPRREEAVAWIEARLRAECDRRTEALASATRALHHFTGETA